jgi:nucleoside-diphosphate-sugar epimerase
MKVFLTGATGFIGSHFLKCIINEGYEVIALKRSQKSKTKIQLDKQPIWLIKSLEDVTIEDFFEVDLIVHLAAHTANVPYDTLENCIKYNVLEPLKMFYVASSAGVKNFVVAGSCFEYGKSGERYDFIPTNAPLEPTQTYPTSKAISSIAFYQFALEHKINLSYLRIFQVYGEGESSSRLWPSLKLAAENGFDFPMTKGEQIRDFIYVGDVVKKILNEIKTITNNPENRIKYSNIGSGNAQSLLEFSKFWWQEWNAKGNLLIGKIPYRDGEVMRYVPLID